MELITVQYTVIIIPTTTILATKIILILSRKMEGGGELSAVGREWQVTRRQAKFLQIN